MLIITIIAVQLENVSKVCDNFLSIRGESCFVGTACEGDGMDLEVLIAEIVAVGVI